MICALRFSVSVCGVFAAAFFIALLCASPAWAEQTFVVNSAGDDGDGTCDVAECTLREAIDAANAAMNETEPDGIHFDIPGDGPYTISPDSALPTITDPVVIDGYTQEGALPATANGAATLKIELEGSGAGDASGIAIGSDGGGSTVRGMAINRFSDGTVDTESFGYGIHILSDGNTIEGNHIGTNAAGTERLPNSSAGVLVDGSIENPSGASGNTIGGTDAADRNVISGNGFHGVHIFGTSPLANPDAESASGNEVLGNYIGTDAAGTGRIANGDPGEGFGGLGSGVEIILSSGNVIGGTEAGARNILSGNGQYGVRIASPASSNNEVLGNYIGADATGTDSVTNERDGVRIEGGSSGNVIGGTESGAGNVISGNNSTTSFSGPVNTGVTINGANTTGNKVQGNFIGTDKDGDAPLGNSERNDERGDFYTGNGQFGIRILNSPGNLIGGAEEGAGNVISGNKGFRPEVGVTGTAIEVFGIGAAGNKIQGNFIGTDETGAKRLGNLYGIEVLDAPENLIGGTTAGARNIISGNTFEGIQIRGEAAGGNEIKGNYVGTDSLGTEAIPNATGAGNAPASVRILAPRTVVGGTEAGAGNVISGNGAVLGGGLSGFGVSIGAQNVSNPESLAGSKIQGNFIGTDKTGTVDLGNVDCAIIISNVPDNLVGGTEAGARNVISGNGKAGIQIDSPSASGNKVLGNFIGTDVSGDVAIGNDGTGVLINGAPGNVVGEPGAGNVVSGGVLDEGDGITIQREGATGNSVQANLVGTDVSGTKDLGNSKSGITVVSASDNVIGGAGEGEGNVSSGNGRDGISIANSDAANNVVRGNLVGTDATGKSALPNNNAGVSLLGAPENTIGGAGAGEANILSGNREDGVYIAFESATGNEILGNLIGTGESGASDLGNVRDGVRVTEGAGENTIGGGGDAGSGNTIAFNGATGVLLRGIAGNGNSILRNSIFENGGLGIDLGEDGVTQNDGNDADGGPNNLQNYPVITDASTSGGTTTVAGTLDSAPGEEFVIRFFASPDADPSGFGEGKKFLGEKNVATNSSGTASFDSDFAGAVRAGEFVTATATSSTGDTSEFSEAAEVAVGEPNADNPNSCTITGTPGNDVLRGKPGRDIICGLGGDDVILGRGGNDLILGGAGDDLLRGGNGNDTLVGGPGSDLLRGDGGNDTLNVRDGVRGNDVANGGAGRDRCAADRGDVRRSCP